MAEQTHFPTTSLSEAMLVVVDSESHLYKYAIRCPAQIGRKSTAAKDVPLDSSIVSRNHSEIILSGGKYYYCDKGSLNGTWVNGVLIGGKSTANICELHDGDVLSFDLISGKSSHPEHIVALFTTTLQRADKWKRAELTSANSSVYIGRENDVLVLRTAEFSGARLALVQASDGWALTKYNDATVFVNGAKVQCPLFLKDLDIIQIDDCFFVFRKDHLLFCQKQKELAKTVTTEKVLNICISERVVTQNFKKIRLLQDINLSLHSGEMVLILGGSGAGKTTFINAVMGYEKAKGTIVYDNVDVYQEYDRMKYEIGFVPQQDLLRGSDTVYDTISNAAEMKLPRSMTSAERETRINNVLEELGLKRERETLVSKLSGGQRKRLSIAVEFVANPSLFFLDEPDSGLDDIMGRGLMENLRSIADKGKIVMVITHSPERAGDLFDKVIVLAKSTKDNCGHLAFYGSPKEALAFFNVDAYKGIVKKINRADENGEGLADYFIEKFDNMRKKG
jgi:ABC-type multidrug transport system ATPase subunit